MADDISHFYAFDAVLVSALAEVCGNLRARVYPNSLLVHFATEAERDCFEERCARHEHAAVRKITRISDVEAASQITRMTAQPLPESGQ